MSLFPLLSSSASISPPLLFPTFPPADVGFFLDGMFYPNNSAVTSDIIGQDTLALYCLTNLTTCCTNAEGGVAGEWHLPADSAIFAISRTAGAVVLSRLSAGGPTGIFICEIPDASGQNRTLYLGVGTGDHVMSCDLHVIVCDPLSPFIRTLVLPAITGLEYNRTLLALTCTSRGGPVDSVSWLKDGGVVGSDFTQAQELLDTASAIYQHTLSGDSVALFVGNFTCELSDTESVVSTNTLAINGMQSLCFPLVSWSPFAHVLHVEIVFSRCVYH